MVDNGEDNKLDNVQHIDDSKLWFSLPRAWHGREARGRITVPSCGLLLPTQTVRDAAQQPGLANKTYRWHIPSPFCSSSASTAHATTRPDHPRLVR